MRLNADYSQMIADLKIINTIVEKIEKEIELEIFYKLYKTKTDILHGFIFQYPDSKSQRYGASISDENINSKTTINALILDYKNLIEKRLNEKLT